MPQVHKETITAVPNSVQSRTNVEIEIYGMEGIPQKDQEEHAKKVRDHGGPKGKRQRTDDSDDSDDSDDDTTQFGMPGQMPFPGMGMPPMGMPGMMGPMGGMMGPMGPMGGPMGMPGPNRWPMPNQRMMGPMGMMGGPMGPFPPQMGPGGPMGPNMGPGGPGMMPGNMPNMTGPPGGPFNAVGNISGNSGNTPNQDEDGSSDQSNQPPPMPKPLFPAASNIQQQNKAETLSSGDTSKSSSAGPKSISSNSNLMHPDDEDVSLEEIRGKMQQYRGPPKKMMPPPMQSSYQSRGSVY